MNIIEAGGHHELKYGWRLEFANFDQERYYSGPLGSRALIYNYPQQGTFDTNSFFTLQPGQFPASFGPNMDEAERLCDRVAIFDAGRVVATGTPTELRAAAGASTLDDAFVSLTRSAR